MKLHLPLSLRRAVLTLLITGVPSVFTAVPASAVISVNNLLVESGTKTDWGNYEQVQVGWPTVGEPAVWMPVSETDSELKVIELYAANGTVSLSPGKTLYVYDWKENGSIPSAIIGTLNLNSASLVGGAESGATEWTNMVIGTINMQGAGNTSSIEGGDITLGQIAAEQSGAVLNLKAHGTLAFNGLRSIQNATINVAEDTALTITGAGSQLKAGEVNFTGSALKSVALNAALQMDGYDGLNLGSVTGASTLILGDGGTTVDTTVTATSFTGALHVQSDASFTVTETATLVGESVNSGILATENLTHSGNASLLGVGSLTVSSGTTLENGSSFTLANSTSLNLGAVAGTGTLVLGDASGSADTVASATSFEGSLNIKSDAEFSITGKTSIAEATIDGRLNLTNMMDIELGTMSGSGKLYLGDNALTDGAADTYVSINSVSSGTVYIQKDATLELLDNPVGGTIHLNGHLKNTNLSFTDTGCIVISTRADIQSELSITGTGKLILSTDVAFDSFEGQLDTQEGYSLTLNTCTLNGNSTIGSSYLLNNVTLKATNLALAENASLLFNRGNIETDGAVELHKNAKIYWRSANATISSGTVRMDEGSAMIFSKGTKKSPISLNSVYATSDESGSVTGYGSLQVGAEPDALEGAITSAVSASGVVQAAFIVWNESTLTVGTGEQSIGKVSLDVFGDSVVKGAVVMGRNTIAGGALYMKYGSVRINEGASLTLDGAFHYIQAEEGETLLDDSARGCVMMADNSSLIINSTAVDSFKSIEGTGRLVLGKGLHYEVTEDFSGSLSFHEESANTLTIGDTATMVGESLGYGGSLTVGTLTHSGEASLTRFLVQAGNTELQAGGRLTLKESKELSLGAVSGSGTLALEDAEAVAISVNGATLDINKDSCFTITGDSQVNHLFTVSGEGVFNLGDGNLTAEGEKDVIAESTSLTIGTLNVMSDADMTVRTAGDIGTLVVNDGGSFSLVDGTAFVLGEVTNNGTVVLGNGELTGDAMDTDVSVAGLENAGQLQIQKDARLFLTQDMALSGTITNDGAICAEGMGDTVPVLSVSEGNSLSVNGGGAFSAANLQIGSGASLGIEGASSISLGTVSNAGTMELNARSITADSIALGGSAAINGNLTAGEILLQKSDATLTLTGETVKVTTLKGTGTGQVVLGAGEHSIGSLEQVNLTIDQAASLSADTYSLTKASSSAVISGSGSVNFTETVLEQNSTLTVQNGGSFNLGDVRSNGTAKLVLGDYDTIPGEHDTFVTAGVVNCNFEVRRDAQLVATTIYMNMGCSVSNGGSVVTDHLITSGNFIYDYAQRNSITINQSITVSSGDTLVLRTALAGDPTLNMQADGSSTLQLESGIGVQMENFTGSYYSSNRQSCLEVANQTDLYGESETSGKLITKDLHLNTGATLISSGELLVSGMTTLDEGSRLTITSSIPMTLETVSGSGMLILGDGNTSDLTEISGDTFEGALHIKNDASLTIGNTVTLNGDSELYGSLTTQNLNIEGQVNLSGTGTLLVQSATTLAENATLNLWGSEKLSLGAVSGTGGSTLALGTSGTTTSAVATTFNCSALMLAGDTTFTVSGDFTADTVDMGPEAGATLHVQNGKVSLNDIGNAYGLQTGTLILGDGERRLVTEAQGYTPAVTEADTIAAVNGLNLSALELKSDATLSMTGNGDFKTGTIAMEEGALLDLTISGPIIELGTVTGTGKLVLGAEKRATATSFESALDIGSGATMTVESSYTGALNIGTGATMKVTNEQSGITTLTGESTNAGTLYSRILKLKDKASLSGDGYLANVNTIQLESGTRLNLTNSARPEGTVIGGYEHDTLALNSISGEGAFVMYKDTKVMADSFSGCLGMRTGSTLIVDGKTTLSGVGAGYGTLVTRELVIARNSGFETHYKDALPTSYDYDGEGSNPAVSLTLNLETGSYLHMYKTAMQDFLDSMTNASITLNTDSVFYGYGNLHIDQGIMDKFALLEGKIQVSGIITYDSTMILTGCEGLFEGGVSDPSTAEVFSGDVSGDPSVGELPEAQEVPNDVADEIVQEEFNDGVEPDYEPDLEPDTPDIDPGGGEGGPSAGEVIEGIADAAAITGGAAGIVATGLKAYGKVKAAKYAAAVAVIGIAGGTLTEIVLALTDEDDGDDDDDDDDVISIIENSKELTIVNTSIVTGNSDVFSAVAAKARELKESGELEKLSEYVVVLDGNTEVEIKEQLAAWFPEFSELEDGEICFTSPKTSLTGSVVLSGSDITFKGYHEDDENAKEFNYDRMGDSLTFDKGKESRTTKVISKGTLRLRADDTNVREGTILAAPDVDIKAETLEVSGDSYIVSTKEATLNVSDTTEVSGSTVSLRGVTDGSTLGKLVAKDGAHVVLEGSASSTVKADSVQLNASKLTVKNMNAAVSGKTTIDYGATLTVADATYNTKSMEVKSQGTLVNDNGTISSTDAIVVNGGIVQGSGTFSAITLNSGKLLVNNSSGQMNFTGDLVLGDGEIRFSVDGFVEAVVPDHWTNSVCSSVNMGGQDFIFNSDSVLSVGFGGNTLDVLVAAGETETLSFSLTLVQNVGNMSFFTEEVLKAMLENTQLRLTSDSRAISMNGEDITRYAHNLKYSIETGNLSGTCNIVLSGSLSRVDVVPEPTTATLSLLALVGLALRRRRDS